MGSLYTKKGKGCGNNSSPSHFSSPFPHSDAVFLLPLLIHPRSPLGAIVSGSIIHVFTWIVFNPLVLTLGFVITVAQVEPSKTIHPVMAAIATEEYKDPDEHGVELHSKYVTHSEHTPHGVPVQAN